MSQKQLELEYECNLSRSPIILDQVACICLSLICVLANRLRFIMQGLQPNALEGIARLMDFNDSFWSSKEVLVQHIDSTAQMRAGRVTGFWAEQNHKHLQPPKPYASAVAINPGAEVVVSFQPEQLGNMPDRILARCNGFFLHDQQVVPSLSSQPQFSYAVLEYIHMLTV